MPKATTASPLRGGPDQSRIVRTVTSRNDVPALPARTERGYQVAVISGLLDLTRAPALREPLLRLLRPAASRLHP